jgi:hypothetical protein
MGQAHGCARLAVIYDLLFKASSEATLTIAADRSRRIR